MTAVGFLKEDIILCIQDADYTLYRICMVVTWELNFIDFELTNVFCTF